MSEPTTTTENVFVDIRVRRSPTFEVVVEMELRAGLTTALLGPNGSGKTTIVEALAGLIPIDTGHIEIGGRTVDQPADAIFVPPHLRRVGVVFQEYLLFDHLTVTENIAFGLRCAGSSRADTTAITNELLSAFDLEEFADRKPTAISGGQAQRVAFARALAAEPDVLLLDEPLAALDVSARSRLRRVLGQHLRSYDGPRLLITHDPTDAFLLADEIVVLEAGGVTQKGSPDEIRRHPATPYVAALSGRNLLHASNSGGLLSIDGSDHQLLTSDTSVRGKVLVVIAPSAIALHAEQPHGSPRNTWPTTITAIEPLGDTSRVYLGDPLELSADLTPAAVEALELRTGSAVWASIKATEIGVTSV